MGDCHLWPGLCKIGPMKKFPLLIALLAAALLTGCATVDFTPYVGE